MQKPLWEILVPAYTLDKEFIPIVRHQTWDEFIRKVSPGMTILRSAIGEWQDGDKMIRERMIPVRLLADRDEMYDIAQFTKEFYVQKAVMFYKISDEVIII